MPTPDQIKQANQNADAVNVAGVYHGGFTTGKVESAQKRDPNKENNLAASQQFKKQPLLDSKGVQIQDPNVSAVAAENQEATSENQSRPNPNMQPAPTIAPGMKPQQQPSSAPVPRPV